MPLEKYCCDKEMKRTLYGTGEGRMIEYYQCAINEEHEVFERESERSFITLLRKISNASDKIGTTWKNK